MTARSRRSAASVLVIITCATGVACQLRRPEVVPTRMIEPQLVEPPRPATADPNATPIRLLATQARSHIGRRILHQEPDGELTEDVVWRWSSAPDRYFDTALRLELAANPTVRLVDTAGTATLSATLLAWQLESAGESKLTGVVELQFTDSSHRVRTQVVRASEPAAASLPGDLASAAGRLLRRLASDSLALIRAER